MSAYPYNMFSNNLPTFTSEDLLDHMGLTERTMFGPPPFTWATKAFMARGIIAHGTSLPSGYASGLTTRDSFGVPLGSQMYWDALAPWVVVLAESDNLCTNAYVKISQIQCYVLSKRTGIWNRFGVMGRGYPSIAPGKWKYDYTVSYGPSTAIIDVDGAPCYLPWHTVGPEQVILHNPIIAKGYIDGEDFGGLFVICQSQLVHPPGVAFDATPHYALSLGADLYPSMDATISNNILAGRTYLVAVGGSALKTIPSDGTPRMHYFITSPQVGVTAKDNTSIYELANGATSMYMSNAELAANMPVLTPNLNIVAKAYKALWGV